MKRNSDDIADVDMKPSATPKQISKILECAREQMRAENKVAKLEKDLKAAKAELKLIDSKTLPELMAEASLDECPLGKGYTVKIENIVTASIPSPDSARAENAAERNQIGVAFIRKVAPDLLQNQIIINFGIAEEKFFRTEIGRLQRRKKNLDYSVRSTVHASRLSAWVRKQDSLGKAVDEGALNVHRVKHTVIEAPKVKGAKDRV